LFVKADRSWRSSGRVRQQILANAWDTSIVQVSGSASQTDRPVAILARRASEGVLMEPSLARRASMAVDLARIRWRNRAGSHVRVGLNSWRIPQKSVQKIIRPQSFGPRKGVFRVGVDRDQPVAGTHQLVDRSRGRYACPYTFDLEIGVPQR
jgi:hypothetical protein